jgi:hypothetical protein
LKTSSPSLPLRDRFGPSMARESLQRVVVADDPGGARCERSKSHQLNPPHSVPRTAIQRLVWLIGALEFSIGYRLPPPME